MGFAAQQRDPGSTGFTLVEVLITVVVLALAGLVGAAYAVRGSSDADWQRDRVFAHQKAIAILAELRGMVDVGGAEAAADLDVYDDGGGYIPTLTLTREVTSPYALVAPEHPVSGNTQNAGLWRWSRSISVEMFHASDSRNRRLCTVRIFRRLKGEAEPGTQMAEVSGVIQTMQDPLPTGQVYDLYVLAIDNVMSPWMSTDGMQAYVDGTIADLRGRNPGLYFRVHWIRKLGYGRDDEYAPYANVDRLSTEDTSWAYVYPGTLPETAERATAFSPPSFGARFNQDGESAAQFVNDWSLPETFTDANGNGVIDGGEVYADADGDSHYDAGNLVPYAFADAHNHALRAPAALARYRDRLAADGDVELTWHLLLDQMISEPERYHNAMFLNLHGQVMPMPPVRNYSDAARAPETNPGWRVVTHPERLRPTRDAKDRDSSVPPRFRVHAYKTAYDGAEAIMTQREPLVDANGNGVWDAGEAFTDWNGNGLHDAGRPITFKLHGADFSGRIDAESLPTLKVRSLAGGVDADGDGAAEPYQPFATATQLPEPFRDANGDGVRDVREPWFDINGNGTRDAFEPWVELDGNGVFSATEEDLVDTNGSGTWDKDMPTEAFTDENGNGRWDPAEPYWDMNGDGVWTPPTSPKTPWMAFKPQHFGNTVQEAKYLADYGEPFLDRDGDAVFDSTPEPLVDTNGNGLHDTGYARGEMYFTARYDEAVSATILELHGTPLEAPADAAGAGLGVEARLYDLDYVPCPTPSTITDPDRFSRDLSVVGTFPKNTARWVVEVPTSAIRNVFASAPGAADGDKVDHLLTVETRIGTDLTTGVLWPDRREPTNCSTTYAWFADSLDDVPYSERYQFQGDPRHSPYADTDLIGRSFRNGYNHYFDSFRSSGVDARDQWLAIDGDRVADRWAGRADFDVPRYMDWLRTAFTRSEIFFANVGGLAFEAMSLGGEVAAAGPTLGAGVPMSGVPFGLGAKVDENALFDTGTSSVRGTRKLVREGITTNASRRAGGGWWSKPWLGELAPDSAYATQWKPHGNLVAARAAHAGVFRQVRRSDLPSAQLPRGTQLSDARGELGVLGGTAFFHAGRRGQTFQQGLSGVVGQIVEDGYELGTRYGVALPTAIAVTHPFRLEWGGESKVNGLAVGPAFTDTRTFPRFSTQLMTSYFAEDASATGLLGSAGVRLIAPDNKMARILISSLYENTEDGASFLGRYALLSLVHAHANEGVPGRARRVRQLPSLRITAPLTDALYPDPRQIDVRWNVDWERWDQRPYDTDTPSEFSEKAGELVYRVLYSWNDGGSWHYMQDGSETQPGALARLEDGRPDPKYAVRHRTNPRFQWSTPVTSVPDASYLLRVEAHRSAEPSHYSFKVDRFDVSRPAP